MMVRWIELWRYHPSKITLVALFLFCALPVTVVSALITPPGQVPDETAHMLRASGLMHGVILGHRETNFDPVNRVVQNYAGVMADVDYVMISVENTTQIDGRPVLTESNMDALNAAPVNPTRFFSDIPNTVRYFPAAYVPAAMALGVARAAHLPPLLSFWIARLAMAAAFLVLGGLSLYVARYGEALLLAVLILPTTLFLAGSINQDGILIGLTCLACAYYTRGTRAGRIAALVLFTLVLLAKPNYVLLYGVFALPLLGPGFWTRVRDICIAVLPVIVWIVIVSIFVTVPFVKPPYHPGPLYTGDHSVWFYSTDDAANLHILLAHPSLFIALPWDSTMQQGLAKLHEAIGVLGLLQLLLPVRYYNVWCVALGVAAAGVVFSPRPGPMGAGTAAVSFGVTLLLILATWWLTLIMCYLSWSNVGLNFVDGIEGRYALIMVPFIVLGLPSLAKRFTLPSVVAIAPAALIGVFDIVYVPMQLVWFFYLH